MPGAEAGGQPPILALDDGRLVRVLPEWQGTTFPVSVLTPGHAAESARLKTVRDEFVSAVEAALNG